eukprot:2612865-Amphidinium_carterae.2
MHCERGWTYCPEGDAGRFICSLKVRCDIECLIFTDGYMPDRFSVGLEEPMFGEVIFDCVAKNIWVVPERVLAAVIAL